MLIWGCIAGVCAECGGNIPFPKDGRGEQRKFCSVACSHRQHSRSRWRRLRARNYPGRICDYHKCRNLFLPSHEHSKYCSRRCSYMLGIEQKLVAKKTLVCQLPSCGIQFVSSHHSKRFCSDKHQVKFNTAILVARRKEARRLKKVAA